MMEFWMDDKVAIFRYDDSRTGNRSRRRAITGRIQMGKIGMDVEWLRWKIRNGTRKFGKRLGNEIAECRD